MSRVINVSVSRPDPVRAEHDLLADVIRRAIVQAVAAHQGDDPQVVARRRYGEAVADRFAKAAVAASGQADNATAPYEAQAWFPAAGDPAIPLALPNVRRVEFSTRCLSPDNMAQAYWVGESAPGRVSLLSVEGEVLDPRRVQGLAAASMESLLDPRAEPRLIDDLRRAVAGVINSAFFSAAAESETAPAGLLHGVTPLLSVGDPQADLGQLLETFAGDLSQAAVLCDPTTAGQLALSGAVFQRVRVAGQGEIAGLPQWASRDLMRDSDLGKLILVDQSALALAFDGIEIARSTAATLDMDVDGTPTRVSLFQSSLVAFRVSVRISWKIARPAAVSLVLGVNYSVS